MTPLSTANEVHLALALFGLIGLSVGWILRGWADDSRSRKMMRLIEKSGVWRCEDRGYYLVRQSKLGGEQK